jgi:hypothetical protein
MTVVEAVQQGLTSLAALTAIVPASRIRPDGAWRGLSAPWIVHRPVAATQEEKTHDRSFTMDVFATYQISVFAQTMSEAQQISDIIRKGLNGAMPSGWVAFFAGGPWHVSYEVDPGVHHVAVDFEVYGG